MTNNTKKQYNGLILLTGYLHRLFVAETIYHRLDEPFERERFENAKKLLDEAYTILPVFKGKQSLTDEQKRQLQIIANQTEELMASYFKQETYSFHHKLAIVGSSFYAEQHVNAGIVRLGELFKVEVNKDFHMRIKFYEQRTKMIDYLVHMIENNEQPEEKMLKVIDSLFNDVLKNKEFILNDFKQISQLLELE